jgi:phosphatidylserine/phosphatidylglycerophosphate/cardiolipin synthase-like enzyme
VRRYVAAALDKIGDPAAVPAMTVALSDKEPDARRYVAEASPTFWAQDGTYPPRQGNEIRILIDGQAAYKEISDAFNSAKKFIYLTISFGDQDFLLVPESGETMFDILRSRQKDGVDVRMVVW